MRKGATKLGDVVDLCVTAIVLLGKLLDTYAIITSAKRIETDIYIYTVYTPTHFQFLSAKLVRQAVLVQCVGLCNHLLSELQTRQWPGVTKAQELQTVLFRLV